MGLLRAGTGPATSFENVDRAADATRRISGKFSAVDSTPTTIVAEPSGADGRSSQRGSQLTAEV